MNCILCLPFVSFVAYCRVCFMNYMRKTMILIIIILLSLGSLYCCVFIFVFAIKFTIVSCVVQVSAWRSKYPDLYTVTCVNFAILKSISVPFFRLLCCSKHRTQAIVKGGCLKCQNSFMLVFLWV